MDALSGGNQSICCCEFSSMNSAQFGNALCPMLIGAASPWCGRRLPCLASDVIYWRIIVNRNRQGLCSLTAIALGKGTNASVESRRGAVAWGSDCEILPHWLFAPWRMTKTDPWFRRSRSFQLGDLAQHLAVAGEAGTGAGHRASFLEQHQGCIHLLPACPNQHRQLAL